MAPPPKTLVCGGRPLAYSRLPGIPPPAHDSLPTAQVLLNPEYKVVLLHDDALRLSWIPGAWTGATGSETLLGAPHQPQHLQHLWGRIGQGVVAVNAVKSEVEALIQNVEPELVACAAVMAAYVVCASVFFSHFL
jgi:hypothetical protein